MQNNLTSAHKINSISLFPENAERLFLFFPLIFLLLIPFENYLLSVLFNTTINTTRDYVLIAIVRVLFLNAAHVFVTYFQIEMLPEFKTWVQDRYPGGYTEYRLKMLLFFLISCAFLYSPLYSQSYIGLFALAVTEILSAHHGFMQVRGLSTSYNFKMFDYVKSTELQNKIRNIDNLEKNIIYILCSAHVLRMFLSYLKLEKMISRELFSLFNMAYWVVIIGVVLSFIYTSYSTQKICKTNKPVYLLRLLSFPFSAFSVLANLAMISYHAIEYYFIVFKMNNNSTQNIEQKSKFKNIIVIMTLGVCFFSAFTSYGVFIYTDKTSFQYYLFEFCKTVLLATGIVHFYLDRIIYRMRDNSSRKNIAPLLIKSA